MGGRPGSAPSSGPEENTDADTGAPSTLATAPRIPQKPKEEGPSQAEKAAQIARLEQAIREDETALQSIEGKMKKSDETFDFAYETKFPFEGQAKDAIREKLAKPEIKAKLEALGMLSNGQLPATSERTLLELVGGLNKKLSTGLLPNKEAITQWLKKKFEPYMGAMLASFDAIMKKGIRKETIFRNFNKLTGVEVFLNGTPVLKGGPGGFITYIVTRSGSKIKEDLANLKTYYEVKGRLAENNGKVLALSSGVEGETSNLDAELKKRKLLKSVSFKKSEQALTYLTTAVSTVSDEDLRKRILDHLEKGIEAVEAGPEDLITIEEDGTVKVTKKEDVERQAQAAAAEAEKAEEPATGIQGFIEQFLGKDSVIGKILIAILSMLGLGKAAEASKPASAEQGKQGAEAAPASPSGSAEQAPDEFTKQKDELIAGLTNLKIPKATLDILTKPENKAILEQIIRKKKGHDGRPDWDQYLEAYLKNTEIKELKKPDITAQKIQEILTSKEPEDEKPTAE